MSGRRTRSAARLAGGLALLASAATSAAYAAEPGAPYRQRAATLRVQAQALDTRAHRALLDLYVLDTRLARAETRLSALVAEQDRLQAERDLLARQVANARSNLLVSQQQLGARLRDLYEQGNPDPLAVVLGAESLEDALTKLDDLSRSADLSRRVVAVTSAAQVKLGRLTASLSVQQARVRRAVASARDTARALASAHTERTAYVAGLRNEARLKTGQIARLEATALQVQAKSEQIQQGATTLAAPAGNDPGSGGDTTSSNPVPASPEPGGRTISVLATGYSLPGHTATGMPVGWGIVAVDPSVIPLGTRLSVPGYGEAVAADTGSAVHGNVIDLWFPTFAQALAWGRRTVTITLH